MRQPTTGEAHLVHVRHGAERGEDSDERGDHPGGSGRVRYAHRDLRGGARGLRQRHLRPEARQRAVRLPTPAQQGQVDLLMAT